MARRRVSTTVDEDLLATARQLHVGMNDATLLDHALEALIRRHRATELDTAYVRAYADHPLDEPDEWGSLAAWHAAADRARG
jgi:hypothetical protein